jgi:hypothetical protein
MANELNVYYAGTSPIYAIVERVVDSLVWNGTTLEVWQDGNYSDYVILMTDTGDGAFFADMPDVPPGYDYLIRYYEQNGGSPSISADLFLTSEIQYWDGTDLGGAADWKNVLVPMVRHLINDLTVPYKYSLDRIEQAIVISGLIAAQEFSFDTDYTFDIVAPDIFPDPADPDTYDIAAIGLFGLKAACMLSMNNYQGAVVTGIKVRDGDSSVDTTGNFGGYKDIIALGPCSAYNNLLKTLLIRRGSNQGKAVLSPNSSSNSPWGVRGPWGVWGIRGFYNQFSSGGYY